MSKFIKHGGSRWQEGDFFNILAQVRGRSQVAVQPILTIELKCGGLKEQVDLPQRRTGEADQIRSQSTDPSSLSKLLVLDQVVHNLFQLSVSNQQNNYSIISCGKQLRR